MQAEIFPSPNFLSSWESWAKSLHDDELLRIRGSRHHLARCKPRCLGLVKTHFYETRSVEKVSLLRLARTPAIAGRERNRDPLPKHLIPFPGISSV